MNFQPDFWHSPARLLNENLAIPTQMTGADNKITICTHRVRYGGTSFLLLPLPSRHSVKDQDGWRTMSSRWRHGCAPMRKALIVAVIGISLSPTLLKGADPFEGDSVAGDLVAVAPPPFSPGIFPCSDCHDGSDVDTNPRPLTEAHTRIILKHDEKHRWCLDCHDAKERDKLRLASGKLIDFTQSYLLCGQCHGPTLRDWKVGVHGKRTGSWSGKKEYLLCAHCHNPHSPGFAPLKPLPPPVRPEEIR